MDNAPIHNSHQRFNPWQGRFRTGQWVFAKDGEVSKLSCFERATRVFIESQVGAAFHCNVQRLLTRKRLLRRNHEPIPAEPGHGMPEGAKQGNRQIVTAKCNRHARFEQTAQRNNVLLLKRRQTLKPFVPVFINMAIGMGRQDDAERLDACHHVLGHNGLVSQHPAQRINGRGLMRPLESGQ